MTWGVAVGGLAMAVGVAFAGLHLGDSLIEMRRADRVVTVKGLSERDVEATIASWRIPFRGVGDDAGEALAAAERARETIRSFAIDGGIAEGEVSTEPYALRIDRLYLDQGGQQTEVVRYNAVGALRLRTENIDAIDGLVGQTQTLLDAGVLIGDSDFGDAPRPQYLFTELNAIKPDLIRESTENARASAQQFAQDSGSEVGGIASASQGVIQILPRDGEFDERAERSKIVRVVSTVRYYLED